jgi:ATPases with chaperone activity, ATP-binding subunit
MASIFGDYINLDVPVDTNTVENLTDKYSELVALQKDAMGNQLYPSLSLYTTPVKKAERPIVGREKEMDSVLAAMMRAELCNVMLLAEAGTGKTALVQGTMIHDAGRLYLEVNLSKMIADLTDPNQMADKLKMLFSETQAFRESQNIEIVLFMDEFHQVVQLSAAAVEALKPLLADSGTRGVRVIAATTYIEFRKFIQPNQPLVERFQRINLSQPDKATTVQILKSMAKRYGVGNQIHGDHLFEMIYEYTNRYIPANSQPRKSIIILDSMVGWYKYKKRKMDLKLLADVIYEAEGVNVAFRVDATKIKKELDAHVFAQEYATQMLENRLQVCVADLNDKSKPMSSFLFTGSTGVGKTEMTKQLARVLFQDEHRLIRFDMTEYANPDSLDSFRRELTNRVWERPYSIVLLDEIEKACAPVTRILLQVLDDGRLMDENNREVVFTNAYIILTTNAGSEVYESIAQYASDDSGSGLQMKKYEKNIRDSIGGTTGDNRFPPELLGRIDCIIPFQPLSEATQMNIVRAKLDKLAKEVKAKHNIDLAIHTRVIDYLVKDNLDTDASAGGARAAINKMNSEVTAKVARFINANPDITEIIVTIEGDMAFENKNQLESRAYVTVKPRQKR